MPLKLFVSYSHQDQTQLEELLEGLRPLERAGLIEPWTDRLIDCGEDWRDKIKEALAECDLGLFLFSKPFLASDFINDKELKPLLQRAQAEDVRIVPVLLRACGWTHSALGHLNPLPGWDRYIENVKDDRAARDQAWNTVVERVRRWAEEHARGERTVVWHNSPYPGLRAFDEREAPIFTGRADQTEALLNKLEGGARFLAVYGASGSGKSSLVRAGLIPAWRQRFQETDKLPILIVKPNEDADGNPFTPLANIWQQMLGPGTDRVKLKQALQSDHEATERYIKATLRDLPKTAEFLLVVDQFEESFTSVDAALRQPFANFLGRVLAYPRARVVITVRSDFFQFPEQFQELSDWLNKGGGHYQVRSLGPDHYRALIERPARLAGFEFEPGLVDRILRDVEHGANRQGLVPLLEFVLAKLYQPFGERLEAGEDVPIGERCFTEDAYQAIGGTEGAIGVAAKEAVAEAKAPASALSSLFRSLVTVGPDLKATRRRALRSELEGDESCKRLTECLIGDQYHARLLVADDEHVEVAHEVLFDAWQDMADWIGEYQYDLQLRDRMVYEARLWDDGGRQNKYLLWAHERQKPLYESLGRLEQPLNSWDAEPEKSFLRPEAERLLDEIRNPETDHQRRDWIGARWSAIGDPRPGVGFDPNSRLPDILWSDEIAGGEVELEDKAGRHSVKRPLKLAVYPVTRDQYMCFFRDAYDDDAWWDDLTRPEPRWPPTGAGGNYPVGLVTWDEAVAYCRWLDAAKRARGEVRTGYQIRLPTEWEWQLAATGGDRNREFPWHGEWDARKLNSVESELMRTSAVGLYPSGAAPCGALDMAGNCWEWCLNKYREPTDHAVGGDDERVVRGGSWINYRPSCRAAFRGRNDPGSRSGGFGFRLCLSSPIGGH